MSVQAFVSGQSVVTPTGSWAPNNNPTERRRSESLRRDSSSRSNSSSVTGLGDSDGSNIVLAERTSNLISSYRDYISGQDDDEEMLSGGGGGGGRRSGPPPSRGIFHRSQQQQQQSSSPLLRDWNIRPSSNSSYAGSTTASHTSRCEMELEELFDDPFSEDSDCQRKYRYIHPIYQSKKFKRFATLGVLVAGAAVVVWLAVDSSASRSRQANEDGGPDWEGELKEVLAKEDLETKLLHGKEIVDKLDMADKNLNEEENPASSDVATTLNNAVSKDGAMANFNDAEFSAIEAVTRNILCCSKIPDESQQVEQSGDPNTALEFAHAESYHPRWYNRSHGWEGTTYPEAVEFCSSQVEDTGSKMQQQQLCPYDVYCPTGLHQVPLGGYRGHEADVEAGNNSRAPISDYINGWVRVGSENACVQYTVLDPEDDIGAIMKGSGMDGAEMMLDELIGKKEDTQDETVVETSQEVVASNTQEGDEVKEDITIQEENDASASVPSQTSQGGSSAPALIEEKVQANEMEATAKEDDGEAKPEEENEVAAIKEQVQANEEQVQNEAISQQQLDSHAAHLEALNASHQKEQVSAEETNNEESTVPNNGMTSQEKFKENAAHLEALYASHAEKEQGSAEEKNNSESTVPNNNGMTSQEKFKENAAHLEALYASHAATAKVDMNSNLHKKFKPMWLTPSDGWTGGSHADAAKFCASVRGKQLCPYATMCPEGPGGIVMGGRHALELEGVTGVQYAPVLGNLNDWVMIGDNGDGNGSSRSSRCKTHRQLEGKAPAWGLNEDRKEVKQHIMCCTIG